MGKSGKGEEITLEQERVEMHSNPLSVSERTHGALSTI
jgi:hypothetical protein